VRYFVPQPTPSAPPVVADRGAPAADAVDPFLLPPKQAHLAWPLGQRVSMHVYLSTSSNGDVFSREADSPRQRVDRDEGLPKFVWENITFGEWDDARVTHYDVRIPEVSPSSLMFNAYCR
jgi:hypothetical protein